MDCEICFEEFETDGLKAPKILHACGHTFCEKCLKEITVNNVINCPLDRIDTSLADQSLNKNYYIVSKIEEASTTVSEFQDLVCELHPSQLAILYCKEASCQGKTLMICSVCITKGPHKGHAHSSTDEEKRQRKRKLETSETQNSERVAKLEKIVKLNEYALDSCTHDALRDQRKANAEYFKNVKSKASAWYKNYIKNVDTMERVLNSSLLEQEERAKSEEEKTNDDRQVLKIMKKHKKHFESIKRSEVHLCKLPETDISVDLKYSFSNVRLLPAELMIPNVPQLPDLPELPLVQIAPTRHFLFDDWKSRQEAHQFLTNWIPKKTRVVANNDVYVGFEYKNAKAIIWKHRLCPFSDSLEYEITKVYFVNDLSESTTKYLEATVKINDITDATVVLNNKNRQNRVAEIRLPKSNLNIKCCCYNNFGNLMDHLLGL